MDSSLLKALQVLALAAVEDPSYEDTMRHLRRWYSKTLHVDFTRMDEVPDEVVIKDYLEETYSDLFNSANASDVQVYDRMRADIIKGFDGIDPEAEAADDDWVAQELAALKAREPKGQQSPALPETPNLIPEEGSVTLEDEIPE